MSGSYNNIHKLPLLAGLMALLSACSEPSEQATGPAILPKVSVAQVVMQPITDWDEISGRIEAPHSVLVRPRVSGYIDEVAFTEGAPVKQGQLLFQIDPRPFETEVKRLQAQLSQAQANAQRTRTEAQRGERLRHSNAISAELADARSSSWLQAQAQVAALAAELEQARLNLSFTRVTAPIDGRAGRAEITEGNLVTAQQSLLTTVVSTDRVYAYFDADERAYLKYQALARQQGHRDHLGTLVYMGLVDEQGHPHLGRLDFLDNQLNPRTGTISARAVFENPDLRLTPGLFVRLKLVGSSTYEAALIKDEAVGTDLGNKYVLVVDEQRQLAYRRVELGPRVEGLRVVRSGLAAGERIVVNGLQRVVPGIEVDTTTVPMASAATLSRLQQLRHQVENARVATADQPAKPRS